VGVIGRISGVDGDCRVIRFSISVAEIAGLLRIFYSYSEIIIFTYNIIPIIINIIIIIIIIIMIMIMIIIMLSSLFLLLYYYHYSYSNY
jgi:hypothetical protein